MKIISSKNYLLQIILQIIIINYNFLIYYQFKVSSFFHYLYIFFFVFINIINIEYYYNKIYYNKILKY